VKITGIDMLVTTSACSNAYTKIVPAGIFISRHATDIRQCLLYIIQMCSDHAAAHAILCVKHSQDVEYAE
jgi:hypothetical protein